MFNVEMEDTLIYQQISESAHITLQDMEIVQELIVLDMVIMFPCMVLLQFICHPDAKHVSVHFGMQTERSLTTQLHGQISLDT